MMSGGVFLVQNSGELVEMQENDYNSEFVLQDLLARYPRLLVGEQINATTPPRFLLVAQEFAVPDMQDGSGRWALDHLFLDQDGTPTLVEVKLALVSDEAAFSIFTSALDWLIDTAKGAGG